MCILENKMCIKLLYKECRSKKIFKEYSEIGKSYGVLNCGAIDIILELLVISQLSV
jgi:hypothetical protein